MDEAVTIGFGSTTIVAAVSWMLIETRAPARVRRMSPPVRNHMTFRGRGKGQPARLLRRDARVRSLRCLVCLQFQVVIERGGPTVSSATNPGAIRFTFAGQAAHGGGPPAGGAHWAWAN